MSDNKICGWAFFQDGVIENEDGVADIGMVHGSMHYHDIGRIFDEVLEDDRFFDALEGHDLMGEGIVGFEITNISWDDGQMTFPETGQWDYPPHWEYGVTIVEIERFPEYEESPETINDNSEVPF